jgi:hypothetical protein
MNEICCGPFQGYHSRRSTLRARKATMHKYAHTLAMVRNLSVSSLSVPTTPRGTAISREMPLHIGMRNFIVLNLPA